MNYDSWKLGDNIDPKAELLADRCADTESLVDRKLSQAVEEANRVSAGQWEVEPVLVECDDDGEMSLEVSLRLCDVPVRGDSSDLLELGQTLLKLGQSLTDAARSQQTQHGLKMAPSVSVQSEKRAELG